MTAHPAALMLVAAAAFSVMGFCVRLLAPVCDWAFVALVRSAVALAAALVLARASGTAIPVWRPAGLWVRAAAGGTSLACYFYAAARLPLADSTALFSVHPLWIVLLGAVLARRVPARRDVAAVLFGCGGVWLIVRPVLSGEPLATVVALAGSVAAAVSYISLHRLGELNPAAVFAHFSAAGCVTTGLLWVAESGGRTWEGTSAGPIALVACVGASGTVAQLFQTRAFAVGRPEAMSVVGLVTIPFGVIVDAVGWGMTPGLGGLLGVAVTLAAVGWLYRHGRVRPAQ